MKHHFRTSDTDLLRSCQMYFDPSILQFSTRLKQIKMRRHVNGRLREILFKSGGFPWLTFTYIIREQNRCKPQMLLAARAYREGKGTQSVLQIIVLHSSCFTDVGQKCQRCNVCHSISESELTCHLESFTYSIRAFKLNAMNFALQYRALSQSVIGSVFSFQALFQVERKRQAKTTKVRLCLAEIHAVSNHSTNLNMYHFLGDRIQ